MNKLLLLGILEDRRRITYTFLYKEGAEPVSWVVGYSAGTTIVGNSQSKESDHLYLQAFSVGVRTYVTDSVVDLTNINTIWIDWENVGDAKQYSCLIASTNKTATYTTYNARLMVTGNFSRTEQSLDVSGLSGNHYIRIHATGPVALAYSKINAYKVWIE